MKMSIEEYKDKFWNNDADFSTKVFSTLMNYQQIDETKWNNHLNIDSEYILK
jgi:hypothetical protein